MIYPGPHSAPLAENIHATPLTHPAYKPGSLMA